MKQRIKQYFYFWLYTIFSLIIPSLLVIERFGFTTGETREVRWLFGGTLVVIMSLFYFRKHLGKAINNLPPTTFKFLLVSIKELMPLIIMYASFFLMTLQFENILFIIKWSIISNSLALVIRTIHLKEVEKNNIIQQKKNLGLIEPN